MEQLQIHYVDLGVPRITDVRSELSIGRTEGNDLVLNHPSVSRKHARIEARNTHWWIVDLKSTNGVKVNGTLISEAQVGAGDKILIGSVQLDVKAMPSVEFTGESMFDNPSGTVIRRISDFNSEFGLDLGEVAQQAVRPPSEPGQPPQVTREKIFQVLVQVAKSLLQTEELSDLLETVMDMIFKYLPVERGLIILFDEAGNPIPKLTKFIEGADAGDIPISRTILKMVAEQQVSLMTSNALEDARLLGGKSIAIHGIRSAMCVPLWNRQHVIGAVQVDSPIHIGRFTQEDLDLLTALANFAAVAIERAQLAEKIEQERKIRSKMERYHSPAVIDEIVKGAAAAAEDEVKIVDVSILFADISGFTTVSETKAPEEVAAYLSNFFSAAVDAIFAYGGTLDKFIGDAVMAFFGAPIPQEDHSDRAIMAALMLMERVDQWNEQREREGLPPVRIRIGINSGPAVVGNVGTEKRVDYTVLGSSVNIASRLESGVAKPGQLVISQNTLDRVIGSFETESLGEFALKGLQQKMPVYSVKSSPAMKRNTTSGTYAAHPGITGNLS
ncbi:MAG TPA: adenylate/guanylate cyclase domain-containing protein [Thermoanaerobaculia bacterium]|jgi:adenylate cyclase|nr:adenylate/guanylate cyclase domain-containing protein [Thermoanaerobaculia bacterium]